MALLKRNCCSHKEAKNWRCIGFCERDLAPSASMSANLIGPSVAEAILCSEHERLKNARRFDSLSSIFRSQPGSRALLVFHAKSYRWRRSEEGIKPTLYLPRKRAEPLGSVSVRREQGHMADVSKASRFIPSSNYPHSGGPADGRLFFRCLGFAFFSPAISRKILIFNDIWLGPESNRRHEDFQSSALPTELPSL
jgi:hypothetical protein